MPPRVRAGLRDKYGLPAKAFKDKPKTELDTTVVKKAVASVSTSVADFVQANNLISGLANLLITSQASQHQDADPMAALADAERSAIASLASKVSVCVYVCVYGYTPTYKTSVNTLACIECALCVYVCVYMGTRMSVSMYECCVYLCNDVLSMCMYGTCTRVRLGVRWCRMMVICMGCFEV
eukprot:m.99101 g.99101  ORF g.99101 m.99101 type:complete len:181 (-) comp27130_c1_seq3:1735-2277(-)